MATFRFTHRDEDTTIVFGADKVQSWDSIKIGLTRNDTFRGLMRKYSGSIEFVKSMRDRIIRLVDKTGIETKAYLTIEVGNDNKETGSFVRMGDGELKADMTTLDITELSAKLDYVGSGFEEVLMNRIDNEQEYNTHLSVDGDVIPTFTHETVDITLHDRVLELNGSLDTFFNVDDTEDSLHINSDDNSDFGFCIPFTLNANSDTDFKNVIAQPFSIYDISNPENFFLLQSSEDRTVNLKFNINTSVKLLPMVRELNYRPFNDTMYLYLRVVDKDYNEKSKELLAQYDYYSDCVTPFNLPISYVADKTFNLIKGDSIQIYIDANLPQYGVEYSYSFTVYKVNENKQSLINNAKSYSKYLTSTAKCIYPHELISRYVSILTGSQLPFYSDIFGRTDLGYSNDGEWAYLVALNGKMIRSFPFVDCGFATKLKDIFKAYNCILNLGATIETTASGEKRLRIDKFEDLLSSKVVVKLGDLLTGVTRSFNQKYLFSELQVGYKDQEYEELNGLGTFNGQFNFTTPLKSIDSKLDLVCGFRTDDYGIEKIRRMQYADTPTEDVNGDDDIFLVDAIVVDGKLQARKTEGFAVVEGILNPSTVYNLRLSPGRNIKRWGNIIHSAMPTGGTIKFGSGAKNTALITRLESETVNLVEKADINVSLLDNPLMLPETISINEAPITMSQWKDIEANPGGLVEIRNKGIYLYGYMEETEYTPSKKIITMELNRANR